jgi:RNA polymerase sigma factor (TIGR02999 family)
MSGSGERVTDLLARWRHGDQNALARVMPLVYRELRRLAGYYLQGERPGHTLQPTALVHEAYLRLAGEDRGDWRNRAQFLGVAAQLMRRILVDHARARATAKRAGGEIAMEVGGFAGPAPQLIEILAVDEALDRLMALDPQRARIVELRYFAGLTVDETAEALAIAPRTVKRDWAMASAWLRRRFAQKTEP